MTTHQIRLSIKRIGRSIKRPRSLLLIGVQLSLLTLGGLCALPLTPFVQVVQVSVLFAIGLLLPVRVHRFVAVLTLSALPFILAKGLLLAAALTLVPLLASSSSRYRITRYAFLLAIGLVALVLQDTLLYANYADSMFAFFDRISGVIGMATHDFPNPFQFFLGVMAIVGAGFYAFRRGFRWTRVTIFAVVSFMILLLLFTPVWPLVGLLAIAPALNRHSGLPIGRTTPQTVLVATGACAVAAIGFVFLTQAHGTKATRVGILSTKLGLTEPKELDGKSDQPIFVNYFLLQKAMGREVKNLEQLTDDNLKDLDILYIVNPREIPSPETRAAVDRFVTNGGTMVVLTDHTDIDGVMRPTNAFLAPTGIRVRFDSAIPNDPEWRWRFKGRFANEGGFESEGVLSRMGVSVGASLSVTPAARVWAIADDAFSDIGNPYFGVSRLGNTERDRKERTGGLCLIASERRGRGTVIAFGDTSTFQNGNSWRYGQNLSAQVDTMRGQKLGLVPMQALLILCVLGAIVFSVAGGSCAPLFAFGLAYFLTSGFVTRPTHEPLKEFVALDTGHVVKGLKREEGNGFDKVCYSVNKLGIPLAAVESFQEAGQAKALILPPSARSYSADDVQTFRTLLEDGVVTLACGGFDDRLNLNRLSEPLGLTVSDTQLGAAHNASLTASAKALIKDKYDLLLIFKDAWSLEMDSKEWQVLCESWGHPILATREVGKGKLLVCGDSAFFETRTLEVEKQESLNSKVLDSWLSYAIN